MNPTLGSKYIDWSDNCLLLSVIRFIQLLNAWTCTPETDHQLDHRCINIAQKKFESNCHHHKVAEPLIAHITARTDVAGRGRIVLGSCRGNVCVSIV